MGKSLNPDKHNQGLTKAVELNPEDPSTNRETAVVHELEAAFQAQAGQQSTQAQ